VKRGGGRRNLEGKKELRRKEGRERGRTEGREEENATQEGRPFLPFFRNGRNARARVCVIGRKGKEGGRRKG
jgi:hypothetical protein